ncbi:hypothetical protein NDU88_010717 [Pleurodeles waltl]|uniref:Uncharacterized protein n=1 Tax=Pleurodeles waltl TaxID=8319 RepID=A0AAV7Q2S6_PLEWA|nr:hypothetical protein NDU88_010717 [Pleurodeles waltl]
MAGTQGCKGSSGALASGGQRTKTTMGAPTPGLPKPWPGAQLGPLNSNRKPPGAQWTPRPEPLGVRQAGAREHPPQGQAGAWPGPLNPNRQGKPPGPGGLPGLGPSGYGRLEEGTLPSGGSLPGPRPRCLATWRARGQRPGKGVLPWGLPQSLAGASEPKSAGEASLGRPGYGRLEEGRTHPRL